MTKLHLDHEVSDPSAEVPAFLQTEGACSILVRERGNPFYREHWMKANAYITEAEEASDEDIGEYINGEVYYEDFIADEPEPVFCHHDESDFMMDGMDSDYDDFVSEYNRNLFQDVA